jgi:hypothetical protein
MNFFNIPIFLNSFPYPDKKLFLTIAEERKMFQFEANGASALAARWHNRVYGA